MPAPRNQPLRSSQRRNSLQDDAPVRTRAGRGSKSGPSKSDQPEVVPPDFHLTSYSPTATKKSTRSASNISHRSFEATGDVYASYERPLLMVFGLTPEFFDGLKKHHGKLPKERKVLIGSLPKSDSSSSIQDRFGSSMSPTSDMTDDGLGADDLSVGSSPDSIEYWSGSEVDAPTMPQPAPRGRGRGRGGGRGGRGRGGRGRGRGGRGRGGIARTTSPARARSSRTSAMFPLAEGDDEDSANHMSQNGHAKPSSLPNEENHTDEASHTEDEDEEMLDENEADSYDEVIAILSKTTTPKGSPPPGLLESILDGTYTYKSTPTPEPKPEPMAKTSKSIQIPKIALTKGSGTQTPRTAASTPAESAVPKLLDPQDDQLSDADLPEPWLYDVTPPKEADCEDRADYLLQTRFKPMVDVQDVIAALTKYPVSQRSTESLFALAENAQYILQAWQDQYLMLDARTAPHMHPAKKACNGGRIPIAPQTFEDMKEADLYGYNYDPKKAPGCQDPWAQRPGAEKNGGRELRTRRNRDMLDSAAPSEEDEDEDNEGRPAKRQRRATRKFDGTDTGTGPGTGPGTGTNTPKKHTGWGGARKKGVSRFSKPASETPEPESRPTKRARTAASNLLHQRIQEMREASLVNSSGDEESTMDVDEYSDTNTKRGRPAGSKNVARRSDYGIKKGPRKKTSEVSTPAPSAHAPNAPPPALQSMSEGQGQFSVDPQQHPDKPKPSAPNSTETVFQATPQPSAAQELTSTPTEQSNTPDAYMTTAPLSQYTGGYVEESSPASASRRKPRVKSEKRSQSMTIWWAERKARKRELDEKNGTVAKTPTSRSNSQSGKRGGRASAGSATPATPSAPPSEPPRPSSMHHTEHPPPPPEAYTTYTTQHPPTAPSPLYMYASAPPQPHPMMLQYSPLAAIPSGGAYPFSAAPPPPNAQYGARALAPAPIAIQQPPPYPSPYGPQSPAGSRPKSSGQPPRNGPPPLAPAPPPHHFSPYAPMSGSRDLPFKVMIPGPAPSETRRESR